MLLFIINSFRHLKLLQKQNWGYLAWVAWQQQFWKVVNFLVLTLLYVKACSWFFFIFLLSGLFSSFNYFFSENGLHANDYILTIQRYVKRDGGKWHQFLIITVERWKTFSFFFLFLSFIFFCPFLFISVALFISFGNSKVPQIFFKIEWVMKVHKIPAISFQEKDSIIAAVMIFVMQYLDLETLVIPKMDIKVSFWTSINFRGAIYYGNFNCQ